jgi:hypothetical protein
LGEKAAAFAREYGWDVIAKQIVDLYEEVLKH